MGAHPERRGGRVPSQKIEGDVLPETVTLIAEIYERYQVVSALRFGQVGKYLPTFLGKENI